VFPFCVSVSCNISFFLGVGGGGRGGGVFMVAFLAPAGFESIVYRPCLQGGRVTLAGGSKIAWV